MSPTTTTRRWFNTESLKELGTREGPQPEDFPSKSFKNKRLHRALAEVDSKYVRNIIEEMIKIPTTFKHIYVDVKVHDLEPGQGTTAMGHWHLDSSLNGEIEYDNFLFVSGQHALTEFICQPLLLSEVNRSVEFDYLVRSVVDLPPRRIKSCTITRYNGRHIHRGPISTGFEERLLVRVIKTDRPQMPTGGI